MGSDPMKIFLRREQLQLYATALFCYVGKWLYNIYYSSLLGYHLFVHFLVFYFVTPRFCFAFHSGNVIILFEYDIPPWVGTYNNRIHVVVHFFRRNSYGKKNENHGW